MIHNVDGAIKRMVRNDINFSRLGIKKNDGVVSVRELLDVGKDRYDIQSEYLYNMLVRELSFVERPTFGSVYYDMDDKIVIGLYITDMNSIVDFKGTNYIILLYNRKNNSIIFDDVEQLPSDIRNEVKRLFLEKYRDLIIEVARYGIENKFNCEYNIYTFNKEYKIVMDNSKLELSLYSRMLKFLDKRMQISYNYEQIEVQKLRTIDTKDGIFRVDTNILGMKRLLKSFVDEDRFRNQELESIPRLFDNLKVDYSELPVELKEGVNKVRSRKK